MKDKVYEIRRADMKNVKQYSVWKHANEEVWEVCDKNFLSGEDILVMCETKCVLEFDCNGSHYRIWQKRNGAFYKKEYYAATQSVEMVVYYRFTDDDIIHITFKDFETDVAPAVTLLRGWNWVEHSNGSGYLESPNGKVYFCYGIYDWKNRYLLYTENDNDEPRSCYKFEEFKEYAESRIRIILGEALIRATKNNQPEEMLQLILEGADVNYVDRYGMTSLQWATNHADSHAIELLILYGADVNLQDISGTTKLMKVCSYGDVAVVNYLLQHGADPYLEDNDGETAADYTKKTLKTVYDKKSEDFKKNIQLLEKEPMKFKFGDAVLPCNEVEDFETLGVGMDIPCRIYLAKSPSCKHEKIAKKLDGEFYSPDNFFIECVARKNEPDGELIISKWILFYVLESGNIHKFGYVEDVPNNAWDYFKKSKGIGKKTFELPVTWEMCGKVKIKAESLEEAMEFFYENSYRIGLPEGEYVDSSFRLNDPEECKPWQKKSHR